MTTFKHLPSCKNWEPYLKKIENLDVYYDPHYVKLLAPKDQGYGEAVYYENEKGRIFYPYIKRSFDEFWDIVTPYGYGGPFLQGDPSTLIDFYHLFTPFCADQGIVTEKIKCHPLYTNSAALSKIMDIELVQETTAVDLNLPYEDIKQGYSSSNKRNINKARRNGVEIIEDSTLSYLPDFQEMYYETMKRNDADQSFFFTDDYFQNQMKDRLLYKPRLLIAKHNNNVIAGALVLLGKKAAHYHLGASLTEHLSLRANNLLFDEMIQYCQKEQAEILHLGGGTSKDDGLFRFKSSFTNNNHYNFFIGKHIINPKVYNDLLTSTSSQSPFFPPYRY
ncbi:lipid II:glycine glycyltransferase FemX [Halobacillus halophilus]|uniref:lipid II:glycine glycyltransferase FemX n=1 Tax=Halobacillus halophilus TaxID=1570 RepID=UPI001CD7407A|nr:GNAT family N-acetyltransferase [Halobacillus halophilus]MCA1012694.1 GNAT family N-acetyltransferase [Halobacillus halophilus]